MTATLPVDSVWTRKITRLYRLSSRRPLVVLSHQLFVPLPLAVLSLRRPLILSLRHPLVHSSRQLVVALPLLILLLRRPLVPLSRRLVVASPLNTPPSRCLVVSLCCLSLSRRASWLSHHDLSSSSHYTALLYIRDTTASLETSLASPQGGSEGGVLLRPRVWRGRHRVSTRDQNLMLYSNSSLTGGQKTHTLPSCSLIMPADCCVASPCAALWLLHRLSSSSHCATLS